MQIKKVSEILRGILSAHHVSYFQRIQWRIIEGAGTFNYAQFVPGLSGKKEESIMNRMVYLFFKRRLKTQ